MSILKRELRLSRAACVARRSSVAHFASRSWWFEQHARDAIRVRDRANMICRWEEILVAVLDPNFRIQIERDHAADFAENFQKFPGGHVIAIRIGRDPKLRDSFFPLIGLTSAINRL